MHFGKEGWMGKKTDRAITGNLKHAQSQQDDLTFVLLKINTHNEYFQCSKPSLRRTVTLGATVNSQRPHPILVF